MGRVCVWEEGENGGKERLKGLCSDVMSYHVHYTKVLQCQRRLRDRPKQARE